MIDPSVTRITVFTRPILIINNLILQPFCIFALHRFATQRFALTSGGRGLCLGAEKSHSQIPLQIRPVYFESLPRFKCRIWGGCPKDGWGHCTLCWLRHDEDSLCHQIAEPFYFSRLPSLNRFIISFILFIRVCSRLALSIHLMKFFL